MIFNKETYNKVFKKGDEIIDVTIRSKTRQAYVIKNRKTGTVKLLFTNTEEADNNENYSLKKVADFRDTYITYKQEPVAEYVAVENFGKVYSSTIEEDGIEEYKLASTDQNKVVSHKVCK